MRPTIVRKEKRHELETIYEDFRGIAQEYKCPVWTASQTNRSGLSAEVITMESISEAFNKCFVADFICTISRTMEDKVENRGRMFVAKNRNGPDGIVYPMMIDTSNVQLHVLEPNDNDTVHKVVTQTAREQKDLLVQKYKQFKGR